MAQIFHHSANVLAKAILLAVAVGVALFFLVWGKIYRSGYISDVNVTRDQPVQFSHKHHVTDDGIDCRYCHTSVENTKFAGIPSTETCMTCHQQIWSNSSMLEPVRSSYQTGRSIVWTKVHVLPDYVYFDHSIHVAKGVGCSTCHGRVDRMALVYRVNTLYMDWCLDCHRAPERYVRPRNQIFNMEWEPPKDQLELGKKLVSEYKIERLTDCYTCHR